MKLKTLIKKLQKLEREGHGDKRVLFDGDMGMPFTPSWPQTTEVPDAESDVVYINFEEFESES